MPSVKVDGSLGQAASTEEDAGTRDPRKSQLISNEKEELVLIENKELRLVERRS